MSSMTEEEAKEIAFLHDIKDILSVKVTSDYIDVIVDDGVCSTERRTIWYDEIISSIKIFDWLNAHHFDYRGLIERDLAIKATEGMYNNKEHRTSEVCIGNFVRNVALWQTVKHGYYSKISIHLQDVIP